MESWTHGVELGIAICGALRSTCEWLMLCLVSGDPGLHSVVRQTHIETVLNLDTMGIRTHVVGIVQLLR